MKNLRLMKLTKKYSLLNSTKNFILLIQIWKDLKKDGITYENRRNYSNQKN